MSKRHEQSLFQIPHRPDAKDPCYSLARQYNVRREAISKLLRRSGVTIRKLRTISEAQVDEAVQLYATGLSAARIADRLGFDQATIHNHLKKRGVTMRGPHDWHQL